MLGGDERDVVRDHLRGRPPGAEHVGVHEVGALDPRGEPLGEGRRGRPLQPVHAADGLHLEAVLAGLRVAGGGGVAREQAGLDAVAGERAREAEGRELGAAGIEDPDDPRDQHAGQTPSGAWPGGRPIAIPPWSGRRSKRRSVSASQRSSTSCSPLRPTSSSTTVQSGARRSRSTGSAG